MSEPFLGEIRMFSGNFAPRGWAFCQGQTLSIAQNSALFSLLGTTYGGNGTTTFNLPDLRGRIPAHYGTSAGQSLPIGTVAGTEKVTLLTTNLPSHTHTVSAAQVGTTNNPQSNVLAGSAALKQFAPVSAANTALNPVAVSAAGVSEAHNNQPPYLAINFIIAVSGIFPSRN